MINGGSRISRKKGLRENIVVRRRLRGLVLLQYIYSKHTEDSEIALRRETVQW